MKQVKSKATGGIGELDFDSKEGVFIVVHYDLNTKLTITSSYKRLESLCEDWEDVPEEPKGYWYYDTTCGRVEKLNHNEDKEIDSSIGNCFETKEEAERAVEKLKAWKRLKDKGVEFYGWRKNPTGTYALLARWRGVPPKMYEIINDLDLLFGGGE